MKRISSVALFMAISLAMFIAHASNVSACAVFRGGNSDDIPLSIVMKGIMRELYDSRNDEEAYEKNLLEAAQHLTSIGEKAARMLVRIATDETKTDYSRRYSLDLLSAFGRSVPVNLNNLIGQLSMVGAEIQTELEVDEKTGGRVQTARDASIVKSKQDFFIEAAITILNRQAANEAFQATIMDMYRLFVNDPNLANKSLRGDASIYERHSLVRFGRRFMEEVFPYFLSVVIGDVRNLQQVLHLDERNLEEEVQAYGDDEELSVPPSWVSITYLLTSENAYAFDVEEKSGQLKLRREVRRLIPVAKDALDFLSHKNVLNGNESAAFMLIKLARFLHRHQTYPSVVETKLMELRNEVMTPDPDALDFGLAELLLIAIHDPDSQETLTANAEIYLDYIESYGERFLKAEATLSKQDDKDTIRLYQHHLKEIIISCPGLERFSPVRAIQVLENLQNRIKTESLKKVFDVPLHELRKKPT